MEENSIELANVEINKYCLLDILSGNIQFYDKPKQKGFTGLYFDNGNVFFAIFPTRKGPMIFYKGSTYLIRLGCQKPLSKKQIFICTLKI
jgi:hypothetical protein